MTATEDMNIKIYDNGGNTFDRYTVIYMNYPERNGLFTCLGMSENPFHPQGFGQHGSAQDGKHLGQEISFEELPAECQKAVLNDIDN